MNFKRVITRFAGLLLTTIALASCNDGETQPLADLLVISDENIAAIEIVATKDTIAIGETFELQATDGLGGADITHELRWTSINPAVAKVTGAGVIEGIAEGIATINAVIGTLEGSLDINVSSAAVVAVALSATTPADACADTQFTATAMFSDGREDDATSVAIWDSADETVATFDAVTLGLLRTFQSGNVDITATVGTITSDVFPLVISDNLTGIDIVAANTTVAIGATEQLTANGSYADNVTRDISDNVTWSSAALAVATVDSSGLLEGVGNGTVEITATCNSLEGLTEFTIGEGGASVVDLEAVGTPPFSVQLGGSLQLNVEAEFSDGTTQDVTEEAEWNVNLALGSAAASVSNQTGTKGLVTTNAIGVSSIRATYEGEEVSFEVDVVP